MTASTAYPLETPDKLLRPIMLQRWADVSFVHLPFPPERVQERLPEGLQVDTFGGLAWVGLVAFRMERIRWRSGPAIPYFGTFPETNVRTYVKGPDGRNGVWFNSLDVTRLLPVLAARSFYRLPYVWSRMDLDHHADGSITYRTRRRWPRSAQASSLLRIRPQRASGGTEITDLERFLTARWGLWTAIGSRLAYAPVDHPSWPISTAELIEFDDELVAAAGYSGANGAPVAHYSPGVDVRIGLPHVPR